ncbi:MAG: tetratricopeptide repeat protein, partial [Acidimicrobiia bacterium]
GHAYVMQVLWGIKLDERYLDKAGQCAARVFALNPQSAHGLRLSAMIHYKRGERSEAARLFKQALTKDPHDTDSMIWLSSVYIRAGKPAAARPLLRSLLERDPLNQLGHSWIGWLDFYEGKGTGALLTPVRQAYEMEPGNPLHAYLYAWALACHRQTPDACSLLHRLSEDSARTGFGRQAVFFKAALKQDRDAALQAVTEDLTSWANWDDVASWWMADCYSLIGLTGEALVWTKNAVRLGMIHYPMFSELDPFLDNARRDPRFQQLVERVKSEWEAFEV